MKCLLAITAGLLLAPVTALAISMSDITNNPDQYKKVLEGTDFITYIDTNSIESLRYSPPFYTMRCKFYVASYNRDLIYESTATVDYNYSRSLTALTDKIYAENVKGGYKDTKEQMLQKVHNEKYRDDGTHISLTNTKQWHLDGKFVGDIKPAYGLTHNYYTRIGAVASELFKEYYNELF